VLQGRWFLTVGAGGASSHRLRHLALDAGFSPAADGSACSRGGTEPAGSRGWRPSADRRYGAGVLLSGSAAKITPPLPAPVLNARRRKSADREGRRSNDQAGGVRSGLVHPS
jgi:hypothetical protein